MTSHERKLIREMIPHRIHGIRAGASKGACDVILFKGDKLAVIEVKSTHKDHFSQRNNDQFLKMQKFAKEGTPTFYAVYFIGQTPKWQIYRVMTQPRKLIIGYGVKISDFVKRYF